MSHLSSYKDAMRVQREFVLEQFQAGVHRPLEMIKKVRKKFPRKEGLRVTSGSTIRAWIKRFEAGDFRVEDAKREGRPPKPLDDRIGQELEKDPYALVVDIGTKLGIGWRKVRRYAVQNNLQNISGKWVPKEIPEELRQRRLNHCTEMVQNYSDQSFWDSVIFEGRRVIYYNKDIGRKGSEATKKKFAEANKEALKDLVLQQTVLNIWWTTGGFIRYKYVSTQEPTEEEYASELRELYEDMKDNGLLSDGRKWTLHRNEGATETSHCPDVVAAFGWNVLLHPQHCPDTSPTDYFILKKFLTAFNTYNSFKELTEIDLFTRRIFGKKAVTYCKDAVKDLVERFHYVIEHAGEYVGTFEKLE